MEAAKFLARLPFHELPKVTVVTALVDSQFDLVTSQMGLQLREAEKETAHKSFQSVKEILEPAGMQLEHVIERRHPSRLILDVAKQRDVDLIVLGARGHSAIYRVVLGSTADFVANHTKCSVLVVRSRTEPGQTETDDEQFNVLLAHDGSSQSKQACDQLLSLDWPELTSKIHIAMMLERPKLIPDDVVYDPGVLIESEESLATLCGSLAQRCEVTHSVKETVHVGSALRVLAEQKKSDLLFLGDTGKSAVKRFFLGSTSRYLLHHADCSVWIAREKQWN